MNNIEEVYVHCNRLKWQSAYIPEEKRDDVESESDDWDSDSLERPSHQSNLYRWETEATLANFDREIEAFDNPVLNLDDEEDLVDEITSATGYCVNSIDYRHVLK